MAKMNVALFAGELGLPVELLLEQLHAAGVAKQKETDPISEQTRHNCWNTCAVRMGRPRARKSR